MKNKTRAIMLIPILLAALVARSHGNSLQLPIDPHNSTVTSNAGHFLITPGGNGPTLAEENLTITVQLRDADNNPMAGYPAAAIWLGQPTGSIAFCAGWQDEADTDTDADGITHFTGAPCAGGWTQAGMRVYADGVAILGGPTGGLLPIDVSSPDINGDMTVNLVDLGSYSQDYNNPAYDFRSDFNGDGVEDLRDLGIYALHNGEVCCLEQ